MERTASEILLIGFGNPGRRDDGLGPALAEAACSWNLPGVTVECNYQLTVEDAAEAARHRIVLFADAAANGPEPFAIRRVEPLSGTSSFSTHSVTPQIVLGLARELFDADPTGYVLAIRGYEFDEFDESLSAKAHRNLQAAAASLKPMLASGRFEQREPFAATVWDESA